MKKLKKRILCNFKRFIPLEADRPKAVVALTLTSSSSTRSGSAGRLLTGFTLVEVMIVVLIIGLLAALIIPNAVKAREKTRANICKNNIRLISHAMDQYILDYNLLSDEAPTEVQLIAQDYIKGGWPQCPSSTIDTYTIPDYQTIYCNSSAHGNYNRATASFDF